DNLFYAAFSPSGAYVPNGTATFPATATDQILVSNSLSWVGTGTNDRIFQMQASTDKKNARLWVYSNGVCIIEYYIERCSSAVLANFAWNDPLIVCSRGAISGVNAFSTSGGSICQ